MHVNDLPICPDGSIDWEAMTGASLDHLATAIDKVNEEHGWNEDNRDEATWEMLTISEIVEAMEHRRDGHPADEWWWDDEDGKPDGVPMEHADALIRELHWFQQHDLSAAKLVCVKMAYNEGRPHKHGREF